MIDERFSIEPKKNIFWKEIKLLGRFVWDNKGKCLFIIAISIAVPFIPFGSAASVPMIQKYRKLRKEGMPKARNIEAKKLEPV